MHKAALSGGDLMHKLIPIRVSVKSPTGASSTGSTRLRPQENLCRERIFVGTLDARLIALDAATGKRCKDFASNGETDLKAALRDEDRGVAYPVTSPPVVINDTVVLGSGMIDNWKAHLGLGTVWAFDARNGELRWKWHAIPRNPDADNAADWRPEQAARTGTANVWSPLSVDEESAAWSSPRPDPPARIIMAVNDLETTAMPIRWSHSTRPSGEVVWSRQLVHHDLWDYDIPSQPVLADIERERRQRPGRDPGDQDGPAVHLPPGTGEPFFPIEERAVPASDIPGEEAWPTQPFPVAPPPLVPQHAITADDAWGLTPWDRGECRELINSLNSEGIYTPPSFEGTMVIPGNAGGSNWGSIAWDPDRQVVIANTLHLPFVVTLIHREDFESERDSGMYPGTEFAPQIGTPYGMRRKPSAFFPGPAMCQATLGNTGRG